MGYGKSAARFAMFSFSVVLTDQQSPSFVILFIPTSVYCIISLISHILHRYFLLFLNNHDSSRHQHCPNPMRTLHIHTASPYLLELGLSKSLMSLVFVAGPLSGLIMQPLIGELQKLGCEMLCHADQLEICYTCGYSPVSLLDDVPSDVILVLASATATHTILHTIWSTSLLFLAELSETFILLQPSLPLRLLRHHQQASSPTAPAPASDVADPT